MITRRASHTLQHDGYEVPKDYLTEEGKIDKKRKERALYLYEEAKEKEGQFTTNVDQWEVHQTPNSMFKVRLRVRRESDDPVRFVGQAGGYEDECRRQDASTADRGGREAR